MARFTFPGGYVVHPGPGNVVRTTPAVVRMHLDGELTQPATDLLIDGVAATSVPTDRDGYHSSFQGPDGVSVLYGDTGVGRPVMLVAEGAPGPRGMPGPSGGPFPDLDGVPAGRVPQTAGEGGVEFIDLAGVIVEGVTPLVDDAVAANPIIEGLVGAIGAKVLARTNVHPAPRFANGPAGWTPQVATLSQPQSDLMRITATSDGAFTATGVSVGPVAAGEKVLVVFKRRGNANRAAYARVTWTGGDTPFTNGWNGHNTNAAGDWVRYGSVVEVPAGATAARVDVLVAPGGFNGSSPGAVGHYVEVTEFLVVRGVDLPLGGITNPASIPAYFDGDTVPASHTVEYAWLGTPGLSASAEYAWTPPTPEVTPTAVADVLAAPAPRSVLDSRYERTFVELSPEAVLQQEFVRSKGGSIGTSGRAAIALRFDHWTNIFGAAVVPMLAARGIPSGLCVPSETRAGETWENTNDNAYSWAQVEAWCIEHGVEIWSHSRSHAWNNGWGENGLVAEIVGSKATIEAKMPKVKVQGWMQPGVGHNPTYLSEFDVTKVDSFYASRAGKLLRSTYPVCETDAIAVRRRIPTGPIHGAGHLTTDTLPLYSLKALVDEAIDHTYGIEFMTHANLDAPGFNTTADFTAFLDYLVEKRDAGLIDIVTPSGLYVADPERSTRTELMIGGDFAPPFAPGTNPGWWFTSEADWTGITVGTDEDRPYLSIPTTRTTIHQTNRRIVQLGLEGETFAWEAEFRRADNAVAANSRIQFWNPTSGTVWSQPMTAAIPAGGWMKRRGCFTIPKGVPEVRLYAGRAAGAGGGVHMRGVRVYKV